MTVCEVMALRAVRNAGLHVPRKVIDLSVKYIKQSQNEDGGFMYMLQGGPSAFPRTAAGVVALYTAGIYEGPEIEKGLDYLTAQIPRGDDLSRESHYFTANTTPCWPCGRRAAICGPAGIRRFATPC